MLGQHTPEADAALRLCKFAKAQLAAEQLKNLGTGAPFVWSYYGCPKTYSKFSSMDQTSVSETKSADLIYQAQAGLDCHTFKVHSSP